MGSIPSGWASLEAEPGVLGALRRGRGGQQEGQERGQSKHVLSAGSASDCPHGAQQQELHPSVAPPGGKGLAFCVLISVTGEGNSLVLGMHSLSQLPSRWAQIPQEGAAERC